MHALDRVAAKLFRTCIGTDIEIDEINSNSERKQIHKHGDVCLGDYFYYLLYLFV